MTTKVLVPELGESVVEATVGNWLVKEGDMVAIGDILVELETDKVDLEVNADVAGVVLKIEKQVDDDVEIGDVLALIEASAGAAPSAAKPAPVKAETPAPAAPKSANGNVNATPVAKRVAASEGVDIAQVSGTGKGGKVTKSDVASASAPAPTPAPKAVAATGAVSELAALLGGSAEKQTRVKMSRRRRTIAKRLIEAQETAAMLTTFNEIDMSAVMELRTRRKAWFLEKTGAKLGYTSFFTKAAISALKAYPRINAEIDGDEMVLKHHYDIGIAVGADEGLVVPVLRNADAMSFADIESKVREMAIAARDGTLALGDLMGGTFTITNGGVFGSMLSTPILNPPQVAILGLHNIVERPVAVNGEVVIRPIMYAALTYDHRIVDGSEAVRFLVHIKELIEDPEDLLLAG